MKSRKKRVYFETEDTIIKRKKGWFEIELDYTQIYNNIAPLIVKLKDKWAIKYLFWIIPQSNEENMLPHSEMIMKNFQEWLRSQNIEDVPSVKSIKDAVTELIKNKIFIKHGNNCYQLNPLFIWSDSTNKRIEHIKSLNEHTDVDIHLIEEPEIIKYSK